MADNTKQSEPLTLESVQAQLDTERTAHQATKDALAVALEGKADAADALAEATKIIDGQKQTIADQAQRIIDLQTSPAAFPQIEVNKVAYEIQGKSFKYKGVDYTVEQLLKDKSMQKKLVELGVGFLVKKEA